MTALGSVDPRREMEDLDRAYVETMYPKVYPYTPASEEKLIELSNKITEVIPRFVAWSNKSFGNLSDDLRGHYARAMDAQIRNLQTIEAKLAEMRKNAAKNREDRLRKLVVVTHRRNAEQLIQECKIALEEKESKEDKGENTRAARIINLKDRLEKLFAEYEQWVATLKLEDDTHIKILHDLDGSIKKIEAFLHAENQKKQKDMALDVKAATLLMGGDFTHRLLSILSRCGVPPYREDSYQHRDELTFFEKELIPFIVEYSQWMQAFFKGFKEDKHLEMQQQIAGLIQYARRRFNNEGHDKKFAETLDRIANECDELFLGHFQETIQQKSKVEADDVAILTTLFERLNKIKEEASVLSKWLDAQKESKAFDKPLEQKDIIAKKQEALKLNFEVQGIRDRLVKFGFKKRADGEYRHDIHEIARNICSWDKREALIRTFPDILLMEPGIGDLLDATYKPSEFFGGYLKRIENLGEAVDYFCKTTNLRDQSYTAEYENSCKALDGIFSIRAEELNFDFIANMDIKRLAIAYYALQFHRLSTGWALNEYHQKTREKMLEQVRIIFKSNQNEINYLFKFIDDAVATVKKMEENLSKIEKDFNRPKYERDQEERDNNSIIKTLRKAIDDAVYKADPSIAYAAFDKVRAEKASYFSDTPLGTPAKEFIKAHDKSKLDAYVKQSKEQKSEVKAEAKGDAKAESKVDAKADNKGASTAFLTVPKSKGPG